MWYALQLFVTLGVAYIWLSEVSDEKDVGHAIWLGAIVALYATVIVSGVLNAVTRLIRAVKALLLGRTRQLLPLRGHKKSDKLLTRGGSTGRTRPPRLIS